MSKLPQSASIPGNAAQLASAAYRLPALDTEFLLGDAMRGLRFELEYAKAEQFLRAWGVRSTLVVFGSARSSETGTPAQRRWYALARAFAKLASEEGGALLDKAPVRDNVICTGGGPGVMEAANRGAHDAGAPSIGLNISLPLEQEPNAYSTPDLTFRFHYFAMRKMHFAMRANGLVVFPGGFGTMDELFEVLTLRQTGKSPPMPVVLVDKAYWTEVIDFEAFVRHGMVTAADLALFSFAETPEDIWRALVAGGVTTAHLQAQKTE
jgi:uncharacterized protein (TIGR00730 family)